jgi:transcriptional regulator with XRE-family HTH domain
VNAAKKKQLKRSIGALILKYRKQAGLTQVGLARKAKVSVAYVSLLERGGRLCPLDTLHDLAAALSVPVAILVP